MNHPILNRDRDKIGPNAVSIMRPHPLGNPYAIGPDGERDTVIEKYRAWLDARIQERDPVVCTALLGISPGQALACHCVPARCHGEVIVSALDSGRVGALRKWGCSLQGARSFRYAGIGSRDTPASILDLMTRIARRLSAREPWGYTLLSGGAAGADSAFERGPGPRRRFFCHGMATTAAEVRTPEVVSKPCRFPTPTGWPPNCTPDGPAFPMLLARSWPGTVTKFSVLT